jgi:ABC-2 type transport system ATP-binding protein
MARSVSAVDDIAIQVRGLRKSFREQPAVRGLDFEVCAGEIFGLLGPNGAGKTTTLSMLSTLLAPDAGEVVIGGLDLATRSFAIKHLVGLVPQDLALYEPLSARDNLRFFGRIYGLRGRRLQQRCDHVLEMVHLSDRAHEPVSHFSGGMKRRLNIAVALLHEPRILFLDEPTVGVDPQSRNFLFESVEQLSADRVTIVYTTHYMEEAQRLCHRVAIMDQGEILALDRPAALIANLGGGVIRARLEGAALEGLAEQIRGLPQVEKVDAQDGQVVLRVRDVRRALAEIMVCCQAKDVDVANLEVLQPNLETVFLQLTGKRLRD